MAALGYAAVAALMVLLVLAYVEHGAISGSMVAMQEEITALEVEQVSLLTRYEQAFDLATVKEAAQAAGMRQPDDSQICYIDLPGEDQAVPTTARPRASSAAFSQRWAGTSTRRWNISAEKRYTCSGERAAPDVSAGTPEQRRSTVLYRRKAGTMR